MNAPLSFLFGVVLLALGILIGRWTKRRPIQITGYERDEKGHFRKAVRG
jgi:hypothetical protein